MKVTTDRLWKQLGVAALVVGLGAACSSDDSDDDSSSDDYTVKGALSAGSTSLTANDGIDPSSLKLIVYQVAFSESEYCDDATILSASGEYQDFVDGPTLGQGALADGTYKCVMIEMGSMIKFTPAESTDGGLCTAGEELEMDVCRTGAQGVNMAGDDVTCTTAVNDKVVLYLSTASEEPDDDIYGEDTYPFSLPPTASDTKTGGSTLLNALVVAAGGTGEFVAGMLGKVQESSDGNYCEMDEPTWDFQ